jgi:hypothetical protein
VYFIATFAWTWIIWGIAIAMGVTMEDGSGIAILLLGVLGPMITGILYQNPADDAYQTRVYNQIDEARAKGEPRRVNDVLRGGTTWTVE